MARSIPLLALALADLTLGLRWLWIGGRVMGHADGTGEGLIGMAILVGGLLTIATAAAVLTVALRARRFSRQKYLLALVICVLIGGLPWLAFATLP
jgi:hypothetical protein